MTEMAGRHNAARLEFDAQVRRFEDVRARLEATLEDVRTGVPGRQRLMDSAYARLQARLETMPVIEQAKGIVMAQERCGPEEAFDLLRRASQQANVKVYVLAASLVEQVAGKAAGISLGSEPCGDDGEIMAGLLNPGEALRADPSPEVPADDLGSAAGTRPGNRLLRHRTRRSRMGRT